MSRAGKFEIQVAQGKPTWCRIYEHTPDNRELIISVMHTDLHDLIYAAQKALSEAYVNFTDSEILREVRR